MSELDHQLAFLSWMAFAVIRFVEADRFLRLGGRGQPWLVQVPVSPV